jgi:hypothetical protein
VCHESRAIAFEHADLEEYHDEDFLSWFYPGFDVAFQHCEPEDTWELGVDFDMTGELGAYGELGRGAGIVADRVLKFNPEVEMERGENSNFDNLKIFAELMVSLDIVIIQVSPRLTAESGLFGLLCDATVQLVDATYIVTLARYHDLGSTSSTASEATPLALCESMDSFQERVREWCMVLNTRWI